MVGVSYAFTTLKVLILDQCHGLTDASLYNFISLAPKLEQLSLRGCGQVSDLGLNCLIAPKDRQFRPQMTAIIASFLIVCTRIFLLVI